MTTRIPTKKHIATSFGAKATTYDKHADVQRALLEILVDMARPFFAQARAPWLDAGCGTGMLGELLRNAGVSQRIVCMDLAPECLCVAQEKSASTCPTCGDVEALPFRDSAFGCTAVTSVLQWLDDPQGALSELTRVTAPGGTLLLVAWLEGSFRELSELRAEFGVPDPVRLLSEQTILKALQQAGLAVTAQERISGEAMYPTALAAIKSLVGTGSSAQDGQSLTPSQLFDLKREYERRFNEIRGVPVSHKALIAVARK